MSVQPSNRTYRRDEVARNLTTPQKFDELYAYDGLNRLEDFDRGKLNSTNNGFDGATTLGQAWTLDQTGNWSGFNQTVQNALTQTRTHNKENEITDISKTVGVDWPDPVYDANGNMTTMPVPNDLGASSLCRYDAWNRLVEFDPTYMLYTYEYDGLNRRIKQVEVDVIDFEADIVTHFYYSDQWQVLEERIDSSTNAERQFVWGMRYVDDLVLRDRDTNNNGTLDQRLYALQDALFNVVAITDNTGDVKERFAYQPYGESAALDPDFTSYSGSDYEWKYRFTGRELDLATGLQINRMRYLHQQLGRWISRDPIGSYFPHLSLANYKYTEAHPSSNVDPTGLITVLPVRGSGKILPCGGWDIILKYTSKAQNVGYNGPFIAIQKICILQGKVRDCDRPNCARCEPGPQKECTGCCYIEMIGGGPGPGNDGNFTAEDQNRILPYSTPGCKSLGNWSVTATVKLFKLTDAFIRKLVNDIDPTRNYAGECDAGCKKLPVSLGPAAKLGQLPGWWNNSPEEFDSIDVISKSKWTCCGPYNRQHTSAAGISFPIWP